MFGRLLRIDLTTGAVETGQIPEEYMRQYIGGSALGARLLWDRLDPRRDPLHPDSPLLWVTGPLTGSAGPTNGRFTVCARSPQTGLWGESNIGGFVGPELRFAGWDVVEITGRAPQPVYVWILDDHVEIRPAGHLWDHTDCYETQLRIREEVDQPLAKVACIGRAGERGVAFAGIFSDHGRAAARTGLGMLMGDKRLKALAVRGTSQLTFAEHDLYRKLRVDANRELAQQNLTDVYQSTGTAGAIEYLQILGDMPQKYWTAASFEGASKISGAEMADTILTGTTACQACVIRCGRQVEVKEGRFQTGGKTKGPEYETIASFGSQLLIDDLAAITALGERCDRYGMDTISAGGVIGLAYLMYERGILTTADTGGLELRWGDPDPVFTLLDQIASCDGIGASMAQGSRAFAARYGCPELAVQVNGMEVAMHDPRAFTGQALAYVTSPRGACHNQSDYFSIDMGGAMDEIGVPMGDRFESAGKAASVVRHQHWRTVCNALVMCFFAVVPPSTVVDLIVAATGQVWTLEDLLLAGERAWNLKRVINLRYGWNPANEKLPKLLLEALPDGGQEGHVPDMDQLLNEYYTACAWDRATGWPSQAKLDALDLSFARDSA